MKDVSSLKPEQQAKLPPDVLSQVQMKLADYTQALLAKDPDMPKHLQESHRLLITYPETTHLLDDDEIALLIQGQEKLMNTQIVSDAAKKKGTGRGLTKLSASDL